MLAEIRVESAEKLRNFNTHRRNFGLHSLNVDLHVFSLRTCLLICFISCVTRILRVCKHSSSEFTRTPCSTLANNFRGLIFRARSVRRCSFVALQICKWNYFGFFFFFKRLDFDFFGFAEERNSKNNYNDEWKESVTMNSDCICKRLQN